MRQANQLKLRLIWMTVLVFIIFQPGPVQGQEMGATIIVPDDYVTIQAAIDAANAYDRVFIRAGIYYERITIDKPLTLQGEGILTVIDGENTGYTVHIGSGEITLQDLKVTNGISGIYSVYGSFMPDIVLKSVVADNNRDYGLELIRLYSLYNILIEDCTFSNNGLGGLLMDSMEGGIIRNNEVFNNTRGMYLRFGRYFQVTGNRFHHNRWSGLLFRGYHFLIEKNEFSENYYGVDFSLATMHGVFKDNTVRGNTAGLLLEKAVRDLQVYHNDFIANTAQIKYLHYDVEVTWDNGYPSGGNYWSDYTGQDLDGDGIGDTPYPLRYHKDNYPLMRPLWYYLEADVNITPDSLKKSSNGKSVTAYIQLPNGYDVKDIAISSLMLNHVLPAQSKPVEIGDYNKDGIADLKVKFDRAELLLLIGDSTGDIALTVTGTVDGYKFKGSDLLKVIPR